MKRNKWIGMGGTALLHLLVALLLWLVAIHQPEAQEEGGVPVMLGDVPESQGDADPYTLTDVDVMPAAAAAAAAPDVAPPPAPAPQPPSRQELISQTEEKTVEVKKTEKSEAKPSKKNTPVKETPKKTTPTPAKETPKKVDDSAKKAADEAARKAAEAKKAADAKAAAEAKAAADAKAAAERAAAEAASKRVAGAFGKGTQMGSKGTGTSGSGLQGSPTGNSATGKSTGIGGTGTFDLNGRSLGKGGLPVPVYNVQDEGRVVVSITVNPAGQVISTSIQIKGTTTTNASLRKAAEDAAKKARFNQVEGTNNQTGTITYYFKLR